MAVGRDQGIGIGPVDLELAVGILVVGLIGPPAQRFHALQQFGDQRVLPHQRQLVVAGLALLIEAIGDAAPLRIHQEELGFHPGAEVQPLREGPLQLHLQHPSRGGLQPASVRPQIGGHPGHRGLPGQHHQAAGIGQGQHIAVGGAAGQPGREAGESGTGRGQLPHRRGRHEFGALHAEEIAEREQEMVDAVVGGVAGQVGHGGQDTRGSRGRRIRRGRWPGGAPPGRHPPGGHRAPPEHRLEGGIVAGIAGPVAEHRLDPAEPAPRHQGGLGGAVVGGEVEVVAGGEHQGGGGDPPQRRRQVLAAAGGGRHVVGEPHVDHREQVARIVAAVGRQPGLLHVGLHALEAKMAVPFLPVEGLAGGPAGVDQGKGAQARFRDAGEAAAGPGGIGREGLAQAQQEQPVVGRGAGRAAEAAEGTGPARLQHAPVVACWAPIDQP